MALAMLPDLDVIAFSVGIPYGDPWGHRGLTHSLVAGFALGLGAWLLMRLLAQRTAADAELSPSYRAPGALDLFVLCLAACSHGILDMLTDGGLGVALLAPFDHQRLFWPLHPVPVSPIGLVGFFANGLPVLAWEVVLLCPLGAIGGVLRSERSTRFRAAGGGVLLVVLAVAWISRTV
jgi:inner membrane protein